MNRPLEMLTIDNDIKYSESLCRDAQRPQILLKHRDKHEDAGERRGISVLLYYNWYVISHFNTNLILVRRNLRVI
jgi:hypothetical protein